MNCLVASIVSATKIISFPLQLHATYLCIDLRVQAKRQWPTTTIFFFLNVSVWNEVWRQNHVRQMVGMHSEKWNYLSTNENELIIKPNDIAGDRPKTHWPFSRSLIFAAFKMSIAVRVIRTCVCVWVCVWNELLRVYHVSKRNHFQIIIIMICRRPLITIVHGGTTVWASDLCWGIIGTCYQTENYLLDLFPICRCQYGWRPGGWLGTSRTCANRVSRPRHRNEGNVNTHWQRVARTSITRLMKTHSTNFRIAAYCRASFTFRFELETAACAFASLKRLFCFANRVQGVSRWPVWPLGS